MKPEKITVSATINAPLEKVWTRWTGPEHVINWHFASPDWHCPRATNDLRAGGKFSFTMASRDGAMSFDMEGTYDEVIPLKRLAYTMPDGRKVTVVFESNASGTTLTESFDPENQNSREMQRAGWQAIVDNFMGYAEGE